MRVSTSQIYSIADVGMRNAQHSINKTSEQIATGKRVLSPADDPVAATGILRLNQQLGRLDQFDKNIDAAENSLNREEVALDSIANLMQRMKELTVQAGNTGVNSSSDYKAMAAEVDSRIEELLNLQNTRNSSGQYIFGGHQGGEKPFSADGGGNFSYHGDEGQLRLQVSDTVTVPVSDSGKRLFVDVPSSHNTFDTRPASSNQAQPPGQISVGEIVDQEAYDEFYPRGMRVTFNAPESVSPPTMNYTITDDRGKVLVANEPYSAGNPIELNGIRFDITGSPYPGEPATPASLDFGAVAGVDFSAGTDTVTLTVGGRSETLVLDREINSAADLADALNSTVETLAGSGADRNAARLANLGITADASGLSVANGRNITVRNGSADTDAVFGFDTQNDGTASTNGERAQSGDSFLIESSNKQGLLTTLSRLSEAMKSVEDNPQSKAELGKTIAKTLDNLDNAQTRLMEVQGEVGARLNTLESSRDLNADTRFHSKELLSDLEDLDYAEASTRLQMESMVLSAAQQSFVKVSGLSLFNFI